MGLFPKGFSLNPIHCLKAATEEFGGALALIASQGTCAQLHSLTQFLENGLYPKCFGENSYSICVNFVNREIFMGCPILIQTPTVPKRASTVCGELPSFTMHQKRPVKEEVILARHCTRVEMNSPWTSKSILETESSGVLE